MKFWASQHNIRIAVGVVILLCLTLVAYRKIQAALTLLYFTGHGEDGLIFLEWQTVTELNNSGFYVRRGLTEDGSYTRISNFIPASGDGTTGAYYFFLDTDVVNNVGYWYQLEAMDNTSQSAYYGPVLVIAGVFATPDPTPVVHRTYLPNIFSGERVTHAGTDTK